MSSNRLKYDKCAFDTDNTTNLNQFDYFVFKPKHVIGCDSIAKSSSPCYILPEQRTDIENDLYGITRPASQCPTKKFNPSSTAAPVNYTPAWVFEGIHHITPSGLEYLKR